MSRVLSTPAFGQADLTNCEREQIHLAGSIQPHGVLLVVREPDLVIVQASANAESFLGLTGSPLGQALAALDGDLLTNVSPHLDEPLTVLPQVFRCRVGSAPDSFDGLVHRAAGGGLIIELERAGAPVDLSRHLESTLQSIINASSITTLCDETARIFRDLTGYDRVMVYRFDDDGHGEVFSEQRKAELESFLGNRYPASDIPQIARRLYERNRIRVLADIEYAPVPLRPRLSPISGEDLDMSLCVLRSISPIHVQYLKNMGVGATLVVSLCVHGRLWGLVACHHYQPRFVHFEMRAVCELLAEAVATRVAALESFAQAQAVLSVRRLEQRMVEAISREGDWRNALFDGSRAVLEPVGATGAALLFEDQVLTAGEVPGTPQLREIGAWLNRHPRTSLIATASLGDEAAEFDALGAVACGLLATPVSSTPGEYLIWFRPERIHTVTWGGNPFKPVLIGDDPSTLSPRRSFAQWHQVVEGTCDPWSPADRAAALLIGESVTDVVLQFRSVRMLIAQDRLDQVRQQVSHSDQPVIIADLTGRILLRNEAFERMLRSSHPHLQSLLDLPALFADPVDIRRRVRDLMDQRRAWRGEARLEAGELAGRSVLVRADPVLATQSRVLGFVLLFTDLTERKEAETARRRFQERIIDSRQQYVGQLDSRDALLFQNLLSTVVANAQLAALEITDGVDPARLPQMLEGVRASVARAAEVLQHLIWHATKWSRTKR
jgi:PAS domain S-box-containing protein